MKLPSYRDAQAQQAERAKTGQTSVRVTRATLARLRELQRKYPALGLETLINGLLDLAAGAPDQRQSELDLHASASQKPK